jgi:hypothetical protein
MFVNVLSLFVNVLSLFVNVLPMFYPCLSMFCQCSVNVESIKMGMSRLFPVHRGAFENVRMLFQCKKGLWVLSERLPGANDVTLFNPLV